MWEKWYGHILKHTPAHLDTDMHTHTHRHAYGSRAHTWVRRCVFTVCLPYTRSHLHIYTNTLYKSMCAPMPTHSLLISLSHTRTPTHSQSHTTTCQYCGRAFIEPLHTHSPPAVFGRQTMRNDSKWKCTTCSPIRPLSSKPNICVFLSVCTKLVVRSSEKKAPAYENVWEWLKAPSLVCKATVTNRRSFYCIYMV